MDGSFLDGWSLADVPVRISLLTGELTIHDQSGATLRSWSIEGLHIDAMQEGGTYHLTHSSAPHEQLVLKNGELARLLLARTQQVSALPGGRHKLLFGLACLGAVATLMAGLYSFAPRLAHFIAVRIPLEQERALGVELDVMISLQRCDNREGEATLLELVERLAARSGGAYEVRIVDIPESNAFALPGGVILVTDGLLREAASGDEIGAVLAHEVEHIEQRHVLAGALRDGMLTALWSLTVGDYSGLFVIDPSTAYRIAKLEFTREDELSADRGAVARLHRLGASHRGLLSFFERIQKLHGADEAPDWLFSHPSTEGRIRALRSQKDVLHPAALLSDQQLATLRLGCK
jgi:predicted Zn-dependent protease